MTFGEQVSGVGGLFSVVYVVFGRYSGICVVWEYYCGAGGQGVCLEVVTLRMGSKKYLRVLPLVLWSVNKERERAFNGCD